MKLEKDRALFVQKADKLPVGTKFKVPNGRGMGTLVGKWKKVLVAGDPFWKNEKDDYKTSGEFWPAAMGYLNKKMIKEQTPTFSYAMGGPHDSGDIATKTSGKGSYERIPDPLYDKKRMTFKDYLKWHGVLELEKKKKAKELKKAAKEKDAAKS